MSIQEGGKLHVSKPVYGVAEHCCGHLKKSIRQRFNFMNERRCLDCDVEKPGQLCRPHLETVH